MSNDNINATSSESATSLRYEKTQNRDIINTIERINRSERFKPAVERLLSEFGNLAHETAKKMFKDVWRNVHESHENPKELIVETLIGSPIYKKINNVDFYYTMGIHTRFFVEESPKDDNEKPHDVDSRLSMWYSEKMSQKINREIMERMKSITDNDAIFKDMFHYPLLENPLHDKDTPKIGKEPCLDVINLMYMSSLQHRNTQDGMHSSDRMPFKDSDAVHDGLMSNVAMAFERIDETHANYVAAEG